VKNKKKELAREIMVQTSFLKKIKPGKVKNPKSLFKGLFWEFLSVKIILNNCNKIKENLASNN